MVSEAELDPESPSIEWRCGGVAIAPPRLCRSLTDDESPSAHYQDSNTIAAAHAPLVERLRPRARSQPLRDSFAGPDDVIAETAATKPTAVLDGRSCERPSRYTALARGGIEDPTGRKFVTRSAAMLCRPTTPSRHLSQFGFINIAA